MNKSQELLKIFESKYKGSDIDSMEEMDGILKVTFKDGKSGKTNVEGGKGSKVKKELKASSKISIKDGTLIW